MTPTRGEATRENARLATSEWANDPTTVTEIAHPGFNADDRNGGVAFSCDRGFVIFAFDGAKIWSMHPGGDRGVVDEIERFWRENRHRNRVISLDDLNDWHRAAVAALAAGLDSVGQLPAAERVGVTDIARADYIYVLLRRHARSATQEAALTALAENDWIRGLSGEGDTAHPCPLCGRPAIGRAWHYITVCDDCGSRPVCREGRRVAGHNTSIGGGFEAVHRDDGTVCEHVSREGTVWIDDIECHMGEAKFGGVFVGIAPTE